MGRTMDAAEVEVESAAQLARGRQLNDDLLDAGLIDENEHRRANRAIQDAVAVAGPDLERRVAAALGVGEVAAVGASR